MEGQLRMVYADRDGRVFDHPVLGLAGRMGELVGLLLEEELIPMPEGASLIVLPDRIPLGVDGDNIAPYRSRGVMAVGALLPQGYTRTALPAFVAKQGVGPLPLYGYAAVGIWGDQLYVAAQMTDEDDRWNPRHFNGDDLVSIVEQRMQEFAGNRILEQLSHCALHYSCFTAQNLMYRRWEGGIPVSPVCNADCLGCISLQPSECCPSPQERISFLPRIEEIVQLAVPHLQYGEDGMISFGQGCEGEPSLQYPTLSQAIKKIRRETREGTININTNGGHPEAIRSLCIAGLDRIRVSLFSARGDQYLRYHRGRYGINDVEESLTIAGGYGVYRSLNLLVYPGVTDREEEVEGLVDFLRRTGIEMVQLRNLNIDPDVLENNILPRRGDPLGIPALVRLLQQEFPGLIVGNYSRSNR